MMKEFEYLEHTADIGVTAHGRTLAETFGNTARGLFSLITDLECVNPAESREIELIAPDVESLLVDWLNELIYLFDTEYMLFNRFEVEIIAPAHLTARAWGERIDSRRHTIQSGVKAATSHMLEVKKNNGYTARVIFDV